MQTYSFFNRTQGLLLYFFHVFTKIVFSQSIFFKTKIFMNDCFAYMYVCEPHTSVTVTSDLTYFPASMTTATIKTTMMIFAC